MSATPAYAATPLCGAALLGAAETSQTAPTTTSVIWTPDATNGGKLEEIRVTPIATTVAGLVYVFLYDGTTYHLFDEFTISIATVSTTLAATPLIKTYDNLILKGGWSLRCSQSISGNANLLNCYGFGGSF